MATTITTAAAKKRREEEKIFCQTLLGRNHFKINFDKYFRNVFAMFFSNVNDEID